MKLENVKFAFANSSDFDTHICCSHFRNFGKKSLPVAMLSSLVPYDALAIAATLVTNVICMVATYVVPVVVVLYVTEKLWRRGLIEGISRRAVFITGCDSGFGNGLARHLDSLGVPVYAACLTQEGRKR